LKTFINFIAVILYKYNSICRDMIYTYVHNVTMYWFLAVLHLLHLCKMAFTKAIIIDQ